MDIRNLQTLLVVADERGFTSAAVRLRTSQPALSQLIRRIESELGFEVFDRSVTPVGLTEAGRRFVPQAREICTLYSSAVAGSREASREKGVSIGASPRMARLLFPVFFEGDSRRDLRLIEGSSSDLADLLVRGILDVVVMSGAAVRDDLSFSPVIASGFRAAHSAAHSPRDEYGFLARDLAEHQLLLPASGGVRAHINPFLESLGNPAIALESASSETLLGLAALGVGTALVPDLFITTGERERHPGLRFSPIIDGPPPLISGVAMRRGAVGAAARRGQEIASEALLQVFVKTPHTVVGPTKEE